jgi:membrane protease YdiL (CAAX protease family)
MQPLPTQADDRSTSAPLPRNSALLEGSVAAATTATLIASTLFRDHLLVLWLGVPATLTTDYFARSAIDYFSANLIVRILPLLILGIGLLHPAVRHTVRSRLGCERATTLAVGSGVTCILAFTLNYLGVWPFTWRWPSDSSRQIAAIGIENGDVWAFILWGITTIAVTPLIEETVFRNWIPRGLLRISRSRIVAIIGSSALFAVGHLGYWPLWASDRLRMINAVFLFLASCLLASTVLNRRGCYSLAVTAHVSYNALSYLTLIWAASGSQ